MILIFFDEEVPHAPPLNTAIRPAVPEDQKWVAKLFDTNKSILGNVSGGTVFWRWKAGGAANEHFIVIPELAFCHYRVRKDGSRIVYEIAVAQAAKGKGLGRKLMEHVGRPVELKTDQASEESNAFYRKLGLTCVGKSTGKSGKVMNVYQGW